VSSCARAAHLEAAQFSRPWRPEALSGEKSLSMQNSARCVLPVTSVRMLRKDAGRRARAGRGRERAPG